MSPNFRPQLRDGEFVFVAVSAERARELPAQATIREKEEGGTTVVLRREDAEAAELAYEFVAGWITLANETSLDDVGITAAFSAALTEAGISCNVLAGVYHDHILVPIERAAEALEVLRGG